MFSVFSITGPTSIYDLNTTTRHEIRHLCSAPSRSPSPPPTLTTPTLNVWLAVCLCSLPGIVNQVSFLPPLLFLSRLIDYSFRMYRCQAVHDPFYALPLRHEEELMLLKSVSLCVQQCPRFLVWFSLEQFRLCISLCVEQCASFFVLAHQHLSSIIVFVIAFGAPLFVGFSLEQLCIGFSLCIQQRTSLVGLAFQQLRVGVSLCFQQCTCLVLSVAFRKLCPPPVPAVPVPPRLHPAARPLPHQRPAPRRRPVPAALHPVQAAPRQHLLRMRAAFGAAPRPALRRLRVAARRRLPALAVLLLEQAARPRPLSPVPLRRRPRLLDILVDRVVVISSSASSRASSSSLRGFFDALRLLVGTLEQCTQQFCLGFARQWLCVIRVGASLIVVGSLEFVGTLKLSDLVVGTPEQLLCPHKQLRFPCKQYRIILGGPLKLSLAFGVLFRRPFVFTCGWLEPSFSAVFASFQFCSVLVGAP
ncbi:hypothetical protein C8R43DRAFT_1122238 [Mycena crocata]|nr:hypothetical protein C8R43DRAFT_1122238 [Mycena crocata]